MRKGKVAVRPENTVIEKTKEKPVCGVVDRRGLERTASGKRARHTDRGRTPGQGG